MSCNISSEDLNPLLKELLKKLTDYFQSIGSNFYVIGATARDIILSGIHGLSSTRRTVDLDIAIAIKDWDMFELISKELCEIEGFSKGKKQTQRFWFQNAYVIDIVPFGELAQADNNIYWPPDEEFAMSVVGFTEVANNTLDVTLDNEFSVKVASLPGIFILKLAAFNDRKNKTNKDADDLAFIIENYLDINIERAAAEHYDIYEIERFNTFTAGAALLGRDIKSILGENAETIQVFIQILDDELKLGEASPLLNQIIETHRNIQFDAIVEALSRLLHELKIITMSKETTITNEEFVLEDNQIICALTDEIKPAKNKEQTLQSLIAMLNEEYGFEMADMERDFSISYIDTDDKTKRTKIDLAVFDAGKSHDTDCLIRICIVQDEKIKSKDTKKGVEATLQVILESLENCEFGLWTNGEELHFLQRGIDEWGNILSNDISDFPGFGQSMEELEKWADKSKPRKPANDSLIRTFKRCHDYIYANEGMKKTAFWELLNLIFCKIYDEKRRFMPSPIGESYRRKFWVGVKEQNSEEGQSSIAKRIKGIFEDLKKDPLFSEVFDGNEQINLSDRGLAFVAGELAKYSFLDATVDVKGTAYETIVSNTLKQEAGQFFTPRNLIRCMVEMMDPDENMRILDPACGSGGFLTVVLDHVRKKITQDMYPELSGLYLTERYNTHEVNERVKKYAERMIFGFDFDPDLKKAARMNMVMAGDGHTNIFHINSLDYPQGSKTEELEKIKETIGRSIRTSPDRNYPFETEDAREKFDLIFTNPPFGAKVEVDFEISKRYELGHNWSKDINGNFIMSNNASSSEAPEVLFIEQCYNFLKPGGRLAIVLPDGILGNPNAEYVRDWILKRFKLLASIDLPVETFLPQVGVQASLLFLQKKTQAERDAAIMGEDYEVFMAIAEAVGKDRRGIPVYKRDEDGAELLFDEKKEVLLRDNLGNTKIISKKSRIKRLDDDLPEISLSYANFLKGINL